MNSPYICLTCRRRLSQMRPVKAVQWQTRATFISLSNNKSRKAADGKPERGPVRTKDESGNTNSKYDGIVPHRKTPLARPKKASPGDLLESLFEQTIHPSSFPGEVVPEPRSTLEPYKNADILRKMISESQPFADSWAFFVEHFGPDTITAQLVERKSLPSYLKATAGELFKRIVHAKEQNPLSQTLPSATELSKVFLQLGYLNGADWSAMVFAILEKLLDLKQQGSNDPESEKRLILDLLGAWNVACRDIRHLQKFPGAESSAIYWSALPSISNDDAIHVHQKRGAQPLFSLLVPPFPIRQTLSLPMVALASFGVLSDNSIAAENLSIDKAPLLIVLSRVISVPGLDIGQFFRGGPELNHVEVAEYVKRDWTIMKRRASEMAQYSHSQIDKTKAERLSRVSAHISVTYINRRLHDALTRKNLRSVDELWTDVVQWPVDTSAIEHNHHERGTLSINLANYFILVYMGLRQPNRAIDVWNHMVNNGLTPNLRTWDSMMNGCKAARDYKGLEQVWTKLRMSGVAPDAYCWVTRVSGLIECRQVDAGIAALDEMGRLWIEAAKKKHPRMPQAQLQLVNDVQGAIKPSIEAVNAAIGALFKMNMPNAAYKILAWAGKFGIAPNVITYNTLLRPLIRDGRTKEAMALLQRMQKSGIEADHFTFSIILDETFRSMEGISPEESTEVVRGIFSEMESAGARLDLAIYGKIIRQMLPEGSSANMTAINAVMEHMDKQGMEPNAQIYTMLLEHYFTQTPPNMDAVRNTIERASMTKGGSDEIFWDRAIEGYSRLGETGPAMRILGKVQDSKGKAGWTAMRLLLLALVENQEWDLARILVNNAVIDNGAPVPVEGQGMERQLNWAFWKLAREFGLVEQGQHLKKDYERGQSERASF